MIVLIDSNHRIEIRPEFVEWLTHRSNRKRTCEGTSKHQCVADAAFDDATIRARDSYSYHLIV